MRICFVVRSVYSQTLTYTTTHLAYEAYRRGHDVRYATVNGFTFSEDRGVRASTVRVPTGVAASRAAFLNILHSEAARREDVSLDDFDVVFLRYNPNENEAERDRPKNPAIEFGRMLKSRGVLVVNDPQGLQRAASKMYLSEFPTEIRARTLVTRNATKAKEFLYELRRPAIVKPLVGYGGQDVFFIEDARRDRNVNQILAAVSKNGYVMVQEYLPKVRYGDKRLLLLAGEPIRVDGQVAMYRRISPPGDVRANIHVGGTRKKVEFGRMEERIAEALRPRLVADGLYFVGVDIVGDKLLEINVFCPGGIHNINELYGINVGVRVVEELERRVARRRRPFVAVPSPSLATQ